jgi:RHS repeat-associated protein
MTSDGISTTYQYNAENQLTKFITTSTDIYIYDGDGRRVKKNAASITLYWYDLAGNVIDETTSGGGLISEYIYFNGKRVARRDASNNVHYYFSDHLGSASVVTDALGTMSLCPAGNSPMNYTTIPTGEEESDFYPYGGEMKLCDRAPQNYKFTGKERDAESGLDNFDARYYGSSLGRFMQTDPIWVKADRMLDPQRLNLYAYVRNNPLKLTDPSGMDVVLRTCSGSATVTQGFAQVQNGLKKEDRSHVHLVEGDGKNGFKKGQYGITVDADYKGSAGNFATLQKLANDHSATANIDVLKPTDSFNVRMSLSYDAKKGYGDLSTMSMTPGDKDASFEGYTFFPPGKNSPSPFSGDDDTDVVVNNSTDVPATIHHELRHVLLGDFGRMGNNAKHGLPEVEKQTKDAEKEAHQNEKEQ